MSSLYPLADPILDGAAPGADTDIFADDIALKTEGFEKLVLQLQLETSSVVNLIGKPTADGVKATGSIVCVGGADLIDGELIVLNDGVNPAVTFEVDDDASVMETDTLRALTIDGTETAAEFAAILAAAIDAAPALDITPTDNEDGTIDLENDAEGSMGNVAISDTVADADFTHTGMSGGSGGAVVLPINSGTAIPAGVLNVFEALIHSAYEWNLQIETDSVLTCLFLASQKES